MYISEKYFFLRLSDDLVSNHGFTILHINHSNMEIWLEKQVKNTSHVIRLIQRTFDWKNYLKQDITDVTERVRRLRRIILGRNTKIYNVYVATYPPVDQWDSLKNPIPLNKKAELKVYYLDQAMIMEEKNRLYSDLSIATNDIHFPTAELEMEQMSRYLEAKLISTFNQKNKEEKEVLNNGIPLFTTILLVINIIFFMLIEFNGGTTSASTILKYGAKYNPSIIEGEWWRIVSSMFIHIGTLHLIMNMLALYFIGSAVERIYGNIRFIIIYFFAGVIGGLASFAFNPQLAAGASGAIFGLFGALLFFGMNYRQLFFKTMGWNLLVVIGINIIFGFSVPQIDNGAHLGGLLGGFVAAAMVFFPAKRNIHIQLITCLIYIALVFSFVFYGVNSSASTSSGAVQVQLAQEMIEQENYQQTVEITTYGINHARNYKEELLFYRSYALIQNNQVNEAIIDLERVIDLNPDFAEAHYNLALLYADEGRIVDAQKHAELATNLDPENQDFSTLFQRLSDELEEKG